MNPNLHNYQKKAVEFVLRRKACYLALDAGLGKTLISLTVIKQTGQKAIVIAPKNVALYVWPDEIRKWYPEFSFRVLQGPYRTLYKHENVDILILTYDNITWFGKQKVKFKPRMLILDESHYIKATNTDRFKYLKSMHMLWTEYRLCLSATPAPNSLIDLWAQYYILDKGKLLGRNITTFRKNWCTTKVLRNGGRVYSIPEFLEPKLRELAAPLMFSLQAEDWLDMPDLIENTIKCALPNKIKKIYKEVEKKFISELQAGTIVAQSKAAVIMKLRQIIQGGVYLEDGEWEHLHTEKLEALKGILASTRSPVLCCIQFKGELALIQKEFGMVPTIAGGTPATLTREYITQWNDGSLPFLLCHPRSISLGLNLQKAGHTLVWFGLPWSYEQYYQTVRRLYRQGQKNTVVIHRLVMVGTVDELVLRAIHKKQDIHSALIKATGGNYEG